LQQRSPVATAALRLPRVLLLLLLIPTCMYQSACRKAVGPEVQYARVREEAQHGDLDAALKDVKRAFQEYSGKDIGWAWQFRVLNAHILVLRGSDSEALQLLKEDLPSSLATSETAVRKSLVSGIANESLQQFDAAETDLREAERLARAYQQDVLASVEQARGQLEMDRKKYAEAEANFHAALSAAREQKQQFLEVTALGGLGNAALTQEHFDAAIDWYKEALQLAQSIGMQSSVAKALGNMGWSSFELGDFERALALYQQGAEGSQRSGLVSDRIYWLTRVAKMQFVLRDYAAAETNLGEVLKLARQQDDKRILTECLNDLSLVTLGTGRIELARKYNDEAMDVERAGLDQSGVPNTKMLTARISEARREFGQAERLFQGIVADSKYDQSSRWQAQAHLAKLYEDENQPKKAEHEFAHSLETIQTARASVDDEELRLSFLSSSISFYGDYIDFLIAQGRPDDALRVAEQSRAGTLEEGLSGSIRTIKSSARKFQPQEISRRLRATLLFYWLGEERSYLWAVTPMKTTCIMLPASSEIDGVVKSYRQAVATAKDVAETEQAAGEKLYAMLVAPAQKLIPQNSRVILLPDGSLYSLNFETLIVPAPKPHFWIEDVTLTTASSLSLLASGVSRPAPKQKNLLLVGDALKASDEFDSLPQAEDEMQDVEHYFPESSRTILKRQQATPAAYLASNPERYAYLHFVTHGTASRAQPLESAVILSKEPASGTYKLYARDIVTRHLNAELVTISACNGSGTRAYSGEGLVGLSWAFLRAGAHNVVGALWEVSNAPSTGELMDAFYSGLSRGEDPATALREAKLSFLRSSNSRAVFKKPYYWAPFQLYSGS
jgi:CHAT domain-containing protein